MAGSYVFPGGRVDDGDQAPPGAPCRPAVFRDLSDAAEAAYRTAAVRELMEEANVSITVDDLVPLAHWVTPEIEIRRYDTRFFLSKMPEGQTPKHDESETTALDWLSPTRSDRAIPAQGTAAAAADVDHHPPARASHLDRGCAGVGALETDRARDAGLLQGRRPRDAHAARRSAVSDDSRLGRPGRNPLCAARRSPMATGQAVTGLDRSGDRVLQRAADGFAGRLVRSPDAVRDQRHAVRDAAQHGAERSADHDARARARRLSIQRQGAAARDAGRET